MTDQIERIVVDKDGGKAVLEDGSQHVLEGLKMDNLVEEHDSAKWERGKWFWDEEREEWRRLPDNVQFADGTWLYPPKESRLEAGEYEYSEKLGCWVKVEDKR